MKKYNELAYTKLKKTYNPNTLPFQSTKELTAIKGIIGQDRAVRAMEFGLHVKNLRYNIFMVGLKGTGKTSYAQNIVQEKAKVENTPDDWCYVYNFENPSRPIALNVPPGMGKILCDDIDEFVEDILTKITKVFSSDDYEQRKTDIIKKYQEEKKQLLEELSEYSKKSGFSIKNTSTGFVFAPLVEGEIISDEDYELLDEEIKDDIEKRAEDMQIKATEFLRKIKILERRAKKRIIELDNMIGIAVVQPLMDELLDKYKNHEKILDHLEKIKNDVIENIYDFDLTEKENDEIVVKKGENSFIKKYKVNLFVDHSNDTGAPVVIEFNPTYNNLVGSVEYENEQGTLKTDFTMIKAGAIHRANGGYLVLQANQVLSNLQSWDTLKRTLQTGELSVESLRNQLGIVDIASLKPQPIPIHLKVILIGSPYLYHLLYNYDEDFEKLFKIKVDFDSEMDAQEENEMKIAQFIHEFCEKEGLRHLDISGIAKILEYSHRITGTQKKLTTRFNKMIEILIEADAWAEIEDSPLITENHVSKAYSEKVYRNNKIEEKINEMYEDGKVIIELKGKKIGKINGLAVIDVGDHIFGKPSVISVTTFAGNRGIVNIEREAKMSGSIHDKGVMILEGYLCEKFAQDYPMGLTGKICFEQSYSGVDGDSASSTELYALLSSLSNIPLKQFIAVTGSVNQKGKIQPVGGVSEKIEGFFFQCKKEGLTGKQGVLIPHQNVEDLVLCDEVIEAVKEGEFHIYPVSSIEEGIEILTDIPFSRTCEKIKAKLEKYRGEKKEDGKTNHSSSIFKRR